MKITLESLGARIFKNILLIPEHGNSLLIDNPVDYPLVAVHFGWLVRQVTWTAMKSCSHNFTDGTKGCVICGCPVSQFSASAMDYLTEHDGQTIEDPGYFEPVQSSPPEPALCGLYL